MSLLVRFGHHAVVQQIGSVLVGARLRRFALFGVHLGLRAQGSLPRLHRHVRDQCWSALVKPANRQFRRSLEWLVLIFYSRLDFISIACLGTRILTRIKLFFYTLLL